MKNQITEALRVQFRPEFLNRIDEVIVFHALNDADLAAIVDLLVADLERRLAGQEIELELTPAARSLIVREGTDPAYGARPLKRTIQRLVENPLARALLRGEFKPGMKVVADADAIGGVLVFRSGDATVVADATQRRDARKRAAAPEPAGAGARRTASGRRADRRTRARSGSTKLCGNRAWPTIDHGRSVSHTRPSARTRISPNSSLHSGPPTGSYTHLTGHIRTNLRRRSPDACRILPRRWTILTSKAPSGVQFRRSSASDVRTAQVAGRVGRVEQGWRSSPSRICPARGHREARRPPTASLAR